MINRLKMVMSAVLIVGSTSVLGQNAKAPGTGTQGSSVVKKRKTTRKPVESEMERMVREKLADMQAQIDGLKQQLADKDTKLATAQHAAEGAQQQAAEATAQSEKLNLVLQANTKAVALIQSNVTDLKIANTEVTNTLTQTKREFNEKIESPFALHYKGITITPVAFFAFENVYRQRSINSDVNTPFNSTPFPGAAQANTSELNFSGRQSRLGGLFEGNTGPFKLSGYFEADFLSAGATSNENQSNSYTLRQRQIWGQAATKSGFAVTGGQMWSLVTETKKSTDNRTENLPMTIDAQYHVGFSWERQPSIRIQQRFNNGLTLATSLEEAEILYSGTNANANFFIGNAGTGGGLFNLTANYSNNVAPDVIVKATYDHKAAHLEAGGIARFFRDRYYPGAAYATSIVPATGTPAVGGQNDTKTGGGFFANARFPVTHFADIGIHTMAGTGVGRYGTSTLPDTTVHPDGTLAPIKSYQGLFSAELHPTKKLDLWGYAGGEYAQRTIYLSTLGASAGKLIGYAPYTSSNAGCNTETLPTSTGNGLAGAAPYNPGTPANCLGATRAVIQGTAGITYRIYNNPKVGRLQYQMQYSYLTREAWKGVGGSPKATNNMVFTGFRYYIP